MLPNLVLVGFMGCGKSSIGRRLASLTGHRFLDTDELIVEKEGRPITEIFSTSGEPYFRDLEEKTASDLVGVCGVVLATGGGIVIRPSNREILSKIGIVAWLDSDPELLFERASRSQKRPLLQSDDPKGTFFRLLEERRPLYQYASHFRVDSSELTHDQAAQSLLDEAMRHHSRHF